MSVPIITKKNDFTITINTPVEVDWTLAQIDEGIARMTEEKTSYESSSATTIANYVSQIAMLTETRATAISLGVIPE